MDQPDRLRFRSLTIIASLLILFTTSTLGSRRPMCLGAACDLQVRTTRPVAWPKGDPAGGSSLASTKPNIILILTDDLDFNLGTLDTMPNLQRLLVDKGMTFKDFFVPLALCCPSRVTILRGQYAHNHQVFTNEGDLGGYRRFQFLDLESDTIATALDDAGYQTVLIGKYLNGYDVMHVPPGWDEWYSPIDSAFYRGFDYTLNENGRPVHYGTSEEDYFTDVLRGKGLDFIQRTVPTDAPFFMYIAPAAPHLPARPAPRHKKLFPGAKVPRSPSFDEEDVSDKPSWVSRFSPLDEKLIAEMDASYRHRLQSVQAVDDLIGDLVKALTDARLMKNTYILFTSDNGFHIGQHRLREGKGTPYEEDIHVPLIVRGPGVSAGASNRSLTSMVDLAPTITDLAGAQMHHEIDGRSLLSLFRSEQPRSGEWRQAILLEQFTQGGLLDSFLLNRLFYLPLNDRPVDPLAKFALPRIRYFVGFRTLTYKYIQNSDEREIYDLLRDPYELDNQYLNINPANQEQLSEWMDAFQDCHGDTCLRLEQTPPPSPFAPVP